MTQVGIDAIANLAIYNSVLHIERTAVGAGARYSP